jgi:hypothetical protein
MKPYQKIAMALLVGAAMGGAAIQTIHAQAKPAYVIVAIQKRNRRGVLHDSYREGAGNRCGSRRKPHRRD